jgi:polysaccharide chain length determinant protein (PEP-CTERM system associated)
MHELVAQLLRYARETWRFRWWMLGISWGVCVIGWAVVARLPDQYEASARVFVDTQSVLAPMLRGLAIQTDTAERRVLLMTRTLLSQPNMEKLLRMTDLDLQAKTPEQQEALIDGLRQTINLTATRGENLYTISYEHRSPEMAKLVVKSLLTIFMESNLGEVRKEQDSASQFLEQQIQDYERRMVEAEQRMIRFKQANLGFLPSEGGGYYENLRQMTDKLKSAELELKIEQDRVEVLRKQVGAETSSFEPAPAPPPMEVTADTQDIDRRIQLNEMKLDELLLRFTEKHPDVVSLRRAIGDLKGQRKVLIAEAKKAAAEAPPAFDAGGGPVQQQMQIAVSHAEAEVAAKQAVVNEYRERIKQLEGAVDRVLKVEGEQAQLNRDYQVLKKNHDELVGRLEAARLSRKADTRSETVRFRVIDPPRVPSKPSAPNRLLLSTGVLLAGLLLGTTVAFLFGQLQPTFDERKLLNEVTGLPVLGSVDMIWTPSQLRARQVRNLSFMASIFGLVAVYGLVMTVHLMGGDVLSKIASGMGLS